MGESSLRLKAGWTIVTPNSTSKSGFRTSSKIYESTSSARMGLPNTEQA